MIISRGIEVIRKYYLRRKMLKLIAKFKNNATIGNNFEVEIGANIKNESSDKLRVTIGNKCRVLGQLVCKSTGKIVVGNYTVIQDGVSIRCLDSITIGSFTGIAEGTVITDNNTHPVNIEEWIKHRIRVAPGGPGYPGLGNGWELSESAPVIIGDGVWIGGNCTILKGVTIGDGAIVARGSIVTKDVAPFTIVAGNPAKKVKELSRPSESISQIAERIMREKSV
jgi:acetyltransferase-like isoleucine patch superfamily enzyme